MLEIIICSNHEVLGCDKDQVDEFYAMTERVEIPNGVSVRYENSFKFWNGGPGYRKGNVCLRVLRFGTVASFAEAAKAVAHLITEGTQHWPSSELVHAAFDAIDRLLEVEVPVSVE